MLRKLLFYGVPVLVLMGAGVWNLDQMEAAFEWMRGGFEPSEPTLEEKVETAREEIAALEVRADELAEKKRQLLIRSEMCAIEAEQLEGMEKNLDSGVKSFVERAKEAQSRGLISFSHLGRRFNAADAESQVEVWCSELDGVRKRRQKETRAKVRFDEAARKMAMYVKEMRRSARDLEGKVDELEMQQDLLVVENEIADVTSTLAGFENRGEIGKAIGAIEEEIDRLLATLRVDGRAEGGTIVSAGELATSVKECADRDTVRQLADSYWR